MDRKSKKKYGKKYAQDILMSECGFPKAVDMNKILETLEDALVRAKNDQMKVEMAMGPDEGVKSTQMNVCITHDLGFFVLTYKLSLDEIEQSEMDLVRAGIDDMQMDLNGIKGQMREQNLAIAVLSRKLSEFEAKEDREVHSHVSRQRMQEVIYVVSRGSPTSSVGYGYSATPFAMQALTVTVDRDVCLVGIGVFFGKGLNKVKINVYKGQNEKGSTPIYNGDEIRYEWKENDPRPVRYDLRGDGIVLKEHQLYTIEHLQNGPNTYYMSSAQTSVTEQGVTFKFGKASQSPNGTSPTGGVIPCFFFQK